MKNFIKIIFGSFIGTIFALIFFVVIGSIVVGTLSFSKFRKNPMVKNAEAESNGPILKIDLKGNLVERVSPIPFDINSFRQISMGPEQNIGLYSLINSIKKAGKDKKIKGIYLKFGGLQSSWSSISALRRALIDFKSQGKFIFSYGETLSEMEYYLCSLADSRFVYPQGFVELDGLAATPSFLKGTFEKLGVGVELIRAGEFKSAGETFTMKNLSEANRLQLQTLVDDLWLQFVSDISKDIGKSPLEINQMANELSIVQAIDALNFQLVTELVDEKGVEDRLKDKLELKKDEKLNMVSYQKYSMKETLSSITDVGDKSIALLFLEGNIIDGEAEGEQIASTNVLSWIDEIEKNKDIKAIVLRVNSPGGSALASDVIWQRLERLPESIKLVTSFGGVAASGGYYISAGSDFIFAEPTTVTGSIGVFGLHFKTKQFFNEKIGMTFDRVVTNKFSDSGNSNRQFSAIEKNKMQLVVSNIYSRFKQVVKIGRGYESIDDVDKISQGRVWSGSKAKEIGLIDEVGGLHQAIAKAGELAGLEKSNQEVQIFPRPMDSFERFFKKWFGGSTSISTFFKESALMKPFTFIFNDITKASKKNKLFEGDRTNYYLWSDISTVF